MNKKILIASIFATLMLLVPITSAVDIYSYLDNEAMDNNEVEQLDEYTEIFTHINGWCYSIEEKGIGIFIHHDVELRAYSDITIKGIRVPFNFFDEYAVYVKVPCLFGWIYYHREPYMVYGFAFGNIEWNPS